MFLPFETFIESVEERKIYFLKGNPPNDLISNHLHICLKKSDGKVLYMVCCTSQIDKVQKFIETRHLPLSTMVYLSPDNNNAFEKDTCINCNNVHTCSEKEFKNYYNNDNVSFIGKISEGQFVQILQGIMGSTMIVQEIKNIISEILESYSPN